MTTCLIIIAIVLAQTGVGKDDHVNEPWVAWFVLVFVCIYIAAYAWSCKSTPLCIMVCLCAMRVGSTWDLHLLLMSTLVSTECGSSAAPTKLCRQCHLCAAPFDCYLCI